MSYKEYTVKVHDNGNIYWFRPGSPLYHREDGPAVEYSNGKRCWYIDGEYLTEEQFNNRNKPSCENKIAEIDSKKYQLKEV